MSFQKYTTISEVIAALRNQKIDPFAQLDKTLHLQKLKVTFNFLQQLEYSGKPSISQTFVTQSWSTQDWNNLDLTHNHMDGVCGGCVKTVGELIAHLEQVEKANEGRIYAITHNMQLFTGEIVTIAPIFRTNSALTWSQTTLVEAQQGGMRVTKHLTKLLENMDPTKYTDGQLYEFVQEFIDSHPETPKGYNVYLIPKAKVPKSIPDFRTSKVEVDPKAPGFAAFETAESALYYLNTRNVLDAMFCRMIVRVVRNGNKIFRAHSEKTPNVLVYDSSMVEEIMNDIKQIDQKLAQMNV